MIIANPIYDLVFKRLMEDKKVAKFFIETLLEQTIDDIQVKPQEFTHTSQLVGVSVYRLDFIATIKTNDGTFKKVLIEIQKAKNQTDLMRFRNYLAEQYKKQDEVDSDEGKRMETLPIVTIYLLGFTLPEIDSPAVRVQRQYIDLITHKRIDTKSEFIEKLTHDCYVVQLPRIHGKLQTSLEKLLSVFEQNYFVDERGLVKEYNHSIDNEIIKTMVDILHHVGTDPKEKKELEDELEVVRTFNEASEGLHKLIKEKDKALEEKDKLIEELKKQLGK